MSRYHRINIDGQSLFKTETRLAAGALKPGTFAIINNDDKFETAAAGTVGRVYVIDAAYHEGLGVTDEVPSGSSAIGNYVEEGREMAILCGAGAYKKDQPITVSSNGKGAIGASDVIGWCQDDVVLAADDFIRVRMRTSLNTAAVQSVTVDPASASIAADISETVQLTATVAPANAPATVTWTSSDAAKATVDANGLVTAVAAGSATITATSTIDSGKSDTATITVTAN